MIAVATFRTPVEGFQGVIAGVTFVDGVGQTDDDNAIAYFERHGYEAGGRITKVATKADAEGPYAGLKAADLKAEIAKRNDGREEAAKIPAKGAIAVLVAALEADDATRTDADKPAGNVASGDSGDGADTGTASGDDN